MTARMEKCDRCPMVRSNTWHRPEDNLELRLCDLHEDKHWIALTAAGFVEKYPPLGDTADGPTITITGGDPRECG